MQDAVYIKIRHMNFWFGHYGLMEKSCDDEFRMYADAAGTDLLGYFEVATGKCLEHCLNSESSSFEEEELSGMRSFYESADPVLYRYYYPSAQEGRGFDWLDAPTNARGARPDFIFVWTKRLHGWDVPAIKTCAAELAKRFLHRAVHVEILEAPSFEQTREILETDKKRFRGGKW